MTIRYRRFIFWIFVILFIIFSIIIILFAQGWRFDFSSLSMVKTGGIFIKTAIPGSKIYLNDKYTGATAGLLNYTKLIDDLIPKNYNLFIHKEGYFPWNKIVNVKSGLVTELFSIILLPLDIEKVKVAQLPKQIVADFSVDDETIKIINNKKTGAAKFYDINSNLISNEKISAVGGPASGWKIATSTELISPDKNKKLYASNNKIWIDYLNDTKEEPLKKEGEKETIFVSDAPILFFDWFKDSEHIIWFSNGELIITERDNRGDKRNSVKFYLNIIPPIFWDNKNSNLYFFETNKNKMILYKVNIE